MENIRRQKAIEKLHIKKRSNLTKNISQGGICITDNWLTQIKSSTYL